MFDPATKRWSRRASMNYPRGDFGIEVIPGGRIIVAGGERGNGTQNEMAMFDVEEYIIEVRQPSCLSSAVAAFTGDGKARI